MNDSAGTNEAILEDTVSRSHCRDLESFEELVRKYQPYVFSLAMKFLADEAEASDIVQESFLRVWKHIDRYDPQQKFTTWLYRIVVNVCLDRLRALKRNRGIFFSRDRDPLLEDLPDEHDWDAAITQKDFALIVRTLSRQLTRTQQLVFTLRDLQDLSMDEVASITGLSMGSIKTNLHYARKAIRDMLVRRYGIARGDL
jgi:RNA polymerase sigma-70 factor, ECF subfamily